MTDLQLWPKCNIAVPDGAGGGEPCNESVVNDRLRVCHDHARLCLRCNENPRDPRTSLCPWCVDELDGRAGQDSNTKSNDS